MKGKSPGPSAAIPLAVVCKRQAPTAVAPWQVYLKLYVTKGTELYAELHSEFENFKSGKVDIRSKYSKLFSDLDQSALSTIRSLQFYQTIITKCLHHADEAVLTAVQEYIKAQHKKEVNVHE